MPVAESDLPDCRRHRPRPAQDRIDPQDQFFRLEGFGEIVVGAQRQPLDTVLGLAAGGEQQDGRIAPLAHGFGQLEPVHARHHHIENQEIEGERVEGRQGLGGIRRRGDAEAAFLEVALEKGPDPVVIVDDENMGITAGQLRHAVS